MSLKIPITSQKHKFLFNKILSTELSTCKYKIEAFYEWKNKTQIFSLRFKDSTTIELGINLNFAVESIFFGSNKALELTIDYRSYFIVTYLHCLENITNTVPNTLFQGLVALEAIQNIHTTSTITSYSPLAIADLRLKPIDVHCAIWSLSRICIEQKGAVSQGVQSNCENAISWLVNYTRLPEIEYNESNEPEYSVLSDLLRFKKLAASSPEILAQYSLFNQYGILDFNALTISNLLANEALSDFWVGVIIRVLAFSENKPSLLDITALPIIRNGIVRFKKDCLAYFHECSVHKQELLSANLLAIKKTAMKIEQTFFENGAVETGALHFIQG